MRAPYKDDYYAILEIAPSASQAEIRKAYLRLSKIHHPDLGGSVEIMQLINNAYSVLHDPVERESYDIWYSRTFKNAYTYKYANCNSRDSESGQAYVTLNLLDYHVGYSTHRILLANCEKSALNYLCGDQLYAYVDSTSNDSIIFMAEEAFFKMKLAYDSESIAVKIVDGNIVYDSAILVNINKFDNNYREYLRPNANVLYAQKTDNGYTVLTEGDYRELCAKIADKNKKRTLYTFVLFGLLLVFFIAIVLSFNFAPDGRTSGSKSKDYSTTSSGTYSTKTHSSSASDYSKYVDDAKNKYVPPLSFPAHNTVLQYSGASFCNFEIKTEASQSAPMYYYLKICAPGTSQAVQAVYIHAGNTASLYVPPGTYEIKWVSGDKWYGEERYFNNYSAQKADETFTFDDSHIWTVTLYTVADGNLGTDSIDIDEF